MRASASGGSPTSARCLPCGGVERLTAQRKNVVEGKRGVKKRCEGVEVIDYTNHRVGRATCARSAQSAATIVEGRIEEEDFGDGERRWY